MVAPSKITTKICVTFLPRSCWGKGGKWRAYEVYMKSVFALKKKRKRNGTRCAVLCGKAANATLRSHMTCLDRRWADSVYCLSSPLPPSALSYASVYAHMHCVDCFWAFASFTALPLLPPLSPILQFVHVWQWPDEHCGSRYHRLHIKHVCRRSVLHSKSLRHRPLPLRRTCVFVSHVVVLPAFFWKVRLRIGIAAFSRA